MDAINETRFPPVVDIHGLSILLNKKPSVISIDRCNRPHTLPPACIAPDTRKPLWIVEDVIDWLRKHKEIEQPKKRLGAPTKAERIAKRAAQQQSKTV